MPGSSSGGSAAGSGSGSGSGSGTEPVSASGLLSAARWSEEGLYLKEFVHKHTLPKLVRVVKGNYLGVLGVPSLANSVSCQHVLLVNAGRRRRLLAQGVRFKDGGARVAATGQKVAVPAGYPGYFEILSEDGRSARTIESVAELCRRFPDSVLVREDLRAFVSRSDDVDALRERSRIITRGETLILVGEVLAVKNGGNGGGGGGGGGGNFGSKERFLRCLDASGENVYLPHDLRGCRFSAVAKEGNISGVHTAGNLLNKRPPFMARLVHGDGPVQPGGSSSSSSGFVPELRILTSLEEECLFGLLLGKDSSRVLPLPVGALIKVQAAANTDELEAARPEFTRLLARCREGAESMADRMTIHDVAFARDIRLNGANNASNSSDLSYQQRRKARRGGGGGSSQVLLHHPPMATAAAASSKDDRAPKDEYEEIEQIYDYVRGFAPLPRSARGWRYDAVLAPREDEVNNSSSKQQQQQQHKGDGQQPPEPPPIETMPTGRPATLLNSQVPHSQSMEFGYCATPPPAPTPASPMGQQHPWEYLQTATVDRNLRGGKSGAANKKRQRQSSSSNNNNNNNSHNVNGVDNSENVYGNNATATAGRFVKTPNHGAGRHAHRFFRLQQGHRFGGREPLYLQQQNQSLTLSRTNLFGGGGGGKPATPTSPAPFFQLRYKSLNNLNAAGNSSSAAAAAAVAAAAVEYDTMESSNSGGKTSGDSGGSRTLPEKRSRKLSRPKSLTNLMLGVTGGGGTTGRYNVATPPPASSQQQHGGGSGNGNGNGKLHHYGQQRPQTSFGTATHHSNKLGGGGGTLSGKATRRLGTLYL